MKTIDGSRGEGGGQIVRTSMALAAITGTPLRLTNIRAGRQKPGLMRQHLTSVRAAAAVCDGTLRGDALRSSQIEFEPGPVRGGEFEFAVGTAGSVALVLQTVTPALMAANVAARIAIEGGSHAKMAPPVDFLEHAWGTAVRAMGYGMELDLQRYGFFPAGGARLVADITPAAEVRRLDLRHETPFTHLYATAILSAVPDDVAARELDTLREELAELDLQMEFETVHTASLSPGNVLHARLEGPGGIEVFTEFGERGRRAETVAKDLARHVRHFVDSGAPVGEHLCDQLLVILSVGRGGIFRTVPLTLHARTMLEVIPEFLPVEFRVDELGDGIVEVEVCV